MRWNAGKPGCIRPSVGAQAQRACEEGEGWLVVEGLSAFTRQPLSCGITASGRRQHGEWATTYGTYSVEMHIRGGSSFPAGIASIHFL